MTLTMRDHLVPDEHRLVSKGTNKRLHVTVHETANTSPGADADAHARLQANGNSRKASWHWTVDDQEAVRSYEHTAICWHAGDSYGSSVSVAVEICVNSDGNRAKAIGNAAELVARICVDEGIAPTNVVQHNHWSGKDCPAGLRDGVPMGWTSFLALVAQEHAALANDPDPPKGWLMALTDEEQADLYKKVKSIYRHTVEGPDPKPGTDRKDMTWAQRVIESLRRIEAK